MHTISFVIPCLNEEQAFMTLQSSLSKFIGEGHEIIVVDGGSQDKTLKLAKEIGCTCISTKASRGFQLHAGAKKSTNDILVFLHADTVLPSNADNVIQKALSIDSNDWGRFNVSFTNQSIAFKIIAWFMNKRSCITAMVTGDHTFFVRRQYWDIQSA